MKNRIKEMRQKACLTQRELAEKVGISQQAINQIETEVTNPSYKTLLKIAEALDCPVSDLDKNRPETMSDAEIKYTVDNMLPMTVSERNRLMDKIKVVNDLLEIGTQMTGTTGHCIEVDKIAMKILLEAIEDAKKLCQELPFVG